MRITRLLPTVFVVLAISTPAFAQLGPALAGRTAAAQNAITVNQNPAGIMRLPKLQVAFDTIIAVSPNKFDVDETKSSELGGNPKNSDTLAAIPQFAFSMPVGDRFAVGLGFSIPTGFGSNFGSDWAGRYYADEFSLVFVSLQPVVAARVTDWLFVGVGAAIMYSESETKVAVRNDPGLDDARLKLTIDGLAAGPVASFLVLPSDDFRFGVSWRGEVDPDLEGRPKFADLGPIREGVLDGLGLLDENIKIGLNVPQSVQAGFFWQTTPDLALMADVTWIDWSRFGSVDVHVGDASTIAKTNYKDIYIGSIGAEYRFNELWKGSVGFSYVSSGVSDKNRTLAIPLDAYYVSGVGFEHKVSERLDLHSNFLVFASGNGSVDQGSAGSPTGRLVGKDERNVGVALQMSVVWSQ